MFREQQDLLHLNYKVCKVGVTSRGGISRVTACPLSPVGIVSREAQGSFQLRTPQTDSKGQSWGHW